MADARATLVDLSDASAPTGLTVTVPRSQVEEALSMDEPVDLVLDLTRDRGEDGPGETGRVAVAWEREELEDLLRRSEGDAVTMAFDEDELRRMLDPEFEAHGMREAIAVLAVAVVAGGAAAVASAQPVENTGIGGAGVIEQVRSAETTPVGADIEAARSAAALEASAPAGASGIEAVRAEEPIPATSVPTALASADSSIEAVRSAEPLAASTGSALTAADGIEAVRAEEPIPATSMPTALASAETGIEAVRSAEPLAAAPDTGALAAASGIEAVRSAEPLATDATLASASGGIEAVRSAEAAATRAPAPTDGGIALDMPSPETTAALVGGFALLITGAAFVARSKRHELRLP